MALDFLRQNTMSVPDDEAVTDPAGKRSAKKKLPKGKFSLLLGGNLIVWVIFGVSLIDVKGFSMDRIPVSIPQKLSVSGIVYSENSPSVIISNQIYGVGDVVDGYTITRISRTEVEFDKNGKKITRQTR